MGELRPDPARRWFSNPRLIEDFRSALAAGYVEVRPHSGGNRVINDSYISDQRLLGAWALHHSDSEADVIVRAVTKSYERWGSSHPSRSWTEAMSPTRYAEWKEEFGLPELIATASIARVVDQYDRSIQDDVASA